MRGENFAVKFPTFRCSAGIFLDRNAARIALVGRSRLHGSDMIQFCTVFVVKVYIVAAQMRFVRVAIGTLRKQQVKMSNTVA